MRANVPQEALFGRYVRNAALRFANLIFLGSTPFILSKLIGIVDYGIIAYFISVAWVVSAIGTAGLDVLSIRVISGAFEIKNLGILVDFFRWSHVVFFVVQGLLLLAFLGIATAVTSSTSFTASLSELSLLVVRKWPLIFLTSLFLALTRFWEGVLIGLGHSLSAQLPRLIILPGGFILVVLTIHLKGPEDVEFFMWSYMLVAAVSVFAQAIQMLRLANRYLINLHRTGTLRMSPHTMLWIRSLAPLFLVGLLNVLNDRIGLIILGSVSGPEATGSFDLLFQVAKLAAFPLVVSTAVYGPSFSRVYEKIKVQKETLVDQSQKLNSLLKESAKITGVFGTIIILALMFAENWILGFVSKDLIAHSLALDILLVGQLVNVVVGPVALLLNMTGLEGKVSLSMLVAVALSIGLGFPLAKMWSVNGMAVASTISVTVWNIIVLYYVDRHLGASPFPEIFVRREGGKNNE